MSLLLFFAGARHTSTSTATATSTGHAAVGWFPEWDALEFGRKRRPSMDLFHGILKKQQSPWATELSKKKPRYTPIRRPRPRESSTPFQHGLSLAEAAAYVGITIAQFNKMVASGRMPRPKRGGAGRDWDVASLDRAICGMLKDQDG